MLRSSGSLTSELILIRTSGSLTTPQAADECMETRPELLLRVVQVEGSSGRD